MGFIDGAGSASFNGFRWDVSAAIATVSVTAVAPKTGTVSPSLGVPIVFDVDNANGVHSDVQISVATEAAMTNIVATTTLTDLVNGIRTWQPTGLADQTTYYWRARAADTGGTNWGPWSGTTVVTIANLSGITASSSGAYQSTAADALTPPGLNFGAPPTVWLRMDFAAATAVTAYQFRARPGELQNAPGSFTFQGSSDATSWTTLDTRSGITFADGTTIQKFTLAATATYRYYRLQVTAVPNGGWVTLAEVSLIGDAAASVTVTPWSFRTDLNSGKAFGYSDENVGFNGATVSSVAESIDENVGFKLVPYPGVIEFIDENIGVQVTLVASVAEYVYEGDVSTNRPLPHLWFLWKPFGFANDEVWAYGQGFGNPQSQYAGNVKIDVGPDYTQADVIPSVNEWYLQEAMPEAYTEDRKIYAGTDSAPPVVNQQVEIIRFNIPASIVPEADPVIEHIYVQHSGGPGNAVDWLMYPTIPMSAANVPRPVSTETVLRLAIERDSELGIEQRYLYVDLPEYVISMGRAERPPAFQATARASATLGTWSVEDSLADAAAVNLGATRRWLPDPTKVVAHPEIGTGASLWIPSLGASGMYWRFDELTAPYVDPAYTLQSRLGELEVPAMVFPGDAWAKLTAAAPSGPSFTVAMAAVLHPAASGVGTLLSTFVDGTADANTFHWNLDLESDRISSYVGGKLRQRTLQVTSGRAVIAVVQISGRAQRMVLVDSKPSSTLTTHPLLQPTGQKLYLGRANENDESIARMDVLDFSFWDRALTNAEMWAVANKLDGIYGVTG